MTKRLVFLYDSTTEPWHVDLQAIQEYLTRLQVKGVKSELLDTKDMPEKALEHWRGEATAAAVWHHQRIRQAFGTRQRGGLPFLGKQVPALLVYEEGEEIPVAVYPHSKKREQKYTDISIQDFLEEFAKLLGG